MILAAGPPIYLPYPRIYPPVGDGDGDGAGDGAARRVLRLDRLGGLIRQYAQVT
jgi:hypothetical protein